uniref:Uncharacterized protein n=1 Tax=Rhizophora mucronata TaxID=61149 RepID=A0A2P2JQN7_RHIMU
MAMLDGGTRQREKVSFVPFESVPLIQLFSASMLVQCKLAACTLPQANLSFCTSAQPFLVLGPQLPPLPSIFPLSIPPSGFCKSTSTTLFKATKLNTLKG